MPFETTASEYFCGGSDRRRTRGEFDPDLTPDTSMPYNSNSVPQMGTLKSYAGTVPRVGTSRRADPVSSATFERYSDAPGHSSILTTSRGWNRISADVANAGENIASADNCEEVGKHRTLWSSEIEPTYDAVTLEATTTLHWTRISRMPDPTAAAPTASAYFDPYSCETSAASAFPLDCASPLHGCVPFLGEHEPA